MFNGYNEAPINSSNECNIEKEKKPENVSKWWYGSNVGSQQIRFQQTNRVPEFWSSKSNFVRMQKCNCSDCYSSTDNQSYHNNTTRHRPWLPKTFSVPINKSDELCKLPEYQWENSLRNKTSNDIKSSISNFNANELGAKYPYHRLPEPNQPGVIATVRNPDSAKKPKDEIFNEIGYYDPYRGQQQVFCNPAWNLSKTFTNSDLYDVGEKYQNTNSFKHPSISHSVDQHTTRQPVVEPYTKEVPFLQNRVPSTGQQSFKDELNFNDTPKNCDESNEFSDNKHLKLYHCQMGKEITNIYPVHGTAASSSIGAAQHYSYNLPCRNAYESENQRLSFENLQSDNSFVRKNAPGFMSKSNCDLETETKWQITLPPQHFSDDSLNNLKNSYGIFDPEACKDTKVVRSKVNEKGNSSYSHLHESMMRNENFRPPRTGYNDSRPQNYFPYQNNSTMYRNYIHSDYPSLGYNVPSRHEHHHSVTPEKFQCQYAQKSSQQLTHHYNDSQITYPGKNAPILNPFFQQHERNNMQQQFVSYKDNLSYHKKTNSVSEEFPSSVITKTDYLETIRSEDVSGNRNNKISPLRLLRKKKHLNQNDVEPEPVIKNQGEMQTLDVRKFFSTWVEEEEESETPTPVLVLDCQNLDPEQTKFLYLYENNGIVTLKSADSLKEPDKHEQAQEPKEELFLNQEIVEDIRKQNFKKPVGMIENLSILEPLSNDEASNSAATLSTQQKSNAEVKPLKEEKCFDFNENLELLFRKKVIKTNMSEESSQKETKEKFDFSKPPEEIETTEVLQNKEGQKKLLETCNSLLQVSESKTPDKVESLSACNSNSNSNLHSLPTSEYRRNKFLNYTDQKFNVCPKKRNESETFQNDEKTQKFSDDNFGQQEDIRQTCLSQSCSHGVKTNNDSKLTNKSEQVDGVTTKMSEVNFKNTDDAVGSGEKSEKNKKLSSNKKIKKSKKMNYEDENVDRSDKVTVDQIKFSIQKSHDLKISFKVLNSGGNKYEDQEQRTEENANQGNVNESSNSTELITLKLKSIQNGDASESNRECRNKKLKKDSLKDPVVKIKKSTTYVEEKEPLTMVTTSNNVLEDSNSQDHSNNFQVKETIDSAKIKLTFKRHKFGSETEGKVDRGLNGLRKRTKRKKKIKRQERGAEFTKANLSITEWVLKSKNNSETCLKEIKSEPQEDELYSSCFSVADPQPPGNKNLDEEKNNTEFSHKILDFEETLDNSLENSHTEFGVPEELKAENLNSEKENEVHVDGNTAESLITDSWNGQKFSAEKEKETENVLSYANYDVNSECEVIEKKINNEVLAPPKLPLFDENDEQKAKNTSFNEIIENVVVQNDKNILSREQEIMEIEKSFEEVKNSEVETGNKCEIEIEHGQTIEEKDNENLEVVIDKIGENFSIEKEAVKEECFEKENPDDLIKYENHVESSCHVNSNKSEKCYDFKSPAREIYHPSSPNFAFDNDQIKMYESRADEIEVTKTDCDSPEIVNQVECFDLNDQNIEDEKENKDIVKSLQELECFENVSEDRTKENPLVKTAELQDSSFLPFNLEEKVNFCKVEAAPNEELCCDSPNHSSFLENAEDISDKTLTISSEQVSENNTNILKENGVGHSVEAIQTIYKASTAFKTIPHTTEKEGAKQRETMVDILKETRDSLTTTEKSGNFTLIRTSNGFSGHHNNSQTEKMSYLKDFHKKPCFRSNKVIKRRHSLALKFTGCENLSLSSSRTRLNRHNSCPSQITFSSKHSIPHLDIPVEEIPLPPGNPLPENIFDWKKYFMLQKSEVIDSKKNVQKKSNYQKFLKNWKNEKDTRKHFHKYNFNKCKTDEVIHSVQDSSKIKFSLPKQKNFKSFLVENKTFQDEDEEKRLPKIIFEPKKSDSEESRFRANDKLVDEIKDCACSNKKVCPSNTFDLNPVEQGTTEDVVFENMNSDKENQDKGNFEESLNGFLNFHEEDLNVKDQSGSDLIVEEEPVVATDYVHDDCISREFYKCEDIPTSEDLTIVGEEIEEQKVSDDDKFRNIMQNCLDNAKKFLNEGNLKLLSSSVDNLLEIGCGEMNVEDNQVAETAANHISRDVLLTSCFEDELSLPEKFQPSEVNDDYFLSFSSDGSNNLCSEILPVDNWPYLEEEVPCSPPTENSEDTDVALTFKDSGCQNSIGKTNVSTEKRQKISLSKAKYLKHLRRKSLASEVNSLVSKENKQRRKTVDCLDENFWSHRKHPKKMIREFRNGLENFWQKNINFKYRSRMGDQNKSEKKGFESGERETDYRSSKWQPKVILFRISKNEVEKKGKNICDVQKVSKEILEEINSIPVMKQQTSHDSVQTLSELKRKEREDSHRYLKVSVPDVKSCSSHSQGSHCSDSAKDLEIRKRKKSRFRNLYSKDKKESKFIRDAKDTGKNTSAETSILVDSDTSLTKPRVELRPNNPSSEAESMRSQETRKNLSDNKSFSEKKDKKQKVQNFPCDKRGSVKEDKKVLKKKCVDVTKDKHHHFKRHKHKHRKDHGEKKDSCRSDHSPRNPEKVEEKEEVKSMGQGKDSSEEPWVCQVCGFDDADERISHIKSHPFHCQSCHLAFITESVFVSHLTKKHKDIRNQHHCLLCELSFDTEKRYLQHLETREHKHLESVEKNTINTLFTLLTGQPCPVLGVVEMKPDWLPKQAGTVHFYHQATPLSLALQYLKMRHDLSSYTNVPSSHSK